MTPASRRAATDAITASPWTEEVNGIQWLIPMPGGLIAMTGSRAWQIVGEGSYALNVQPITPSTTQAQPQAFNGCSATVQPIVIDYDVLYVEAIGNTTVRDLSLEFLHQHLHRRRPDDPVQPPVPLPADRAVDLGRATPTRWSGRPATTARCLSMTYLKEQEVYGWARHNTQGLVVGVSFSH